MVFDVPWAIEILFWDKSTLKSNVVFPPPPLLGLAKDSELDGIVTNKSAISIPETKIACWLLFTNTC